MRGVLAVVAFLLVVAAFATADPWGALGASAGVALVAIASVGAGLVLARWTAVLLALALVPAALERSGGLTFDSLFLIVSLVPFMGAAIAAGVAVGRQTGAQARRVATGALAVAAAGAGVGMALELRVVDEAPDAPIVVDDQAGGYGDVRIGMPLSEARLRLGPGVVRSSGTGPRPLDAGPRELSGPTSLPSYEHLAYRDLALMHDGMQVWGFVTMADDAETPAGVGVGDSLAVAERAYRNLSCSDFEVGEGGTPSHVACFGRLPAGPAIWFGGDGIDSIWIYEDRELTRGRTPIAPAGR